MSAKPNDIMNQINYWSVIRYMPDWVRGEMINIGVVVWGNKHRKPMIRFVRDWSRVLMFSLGSIGHLLSFAKNANEIFDDPDKICRTTYPECYQDIQISSPSASMLPARKLLNLIDKTYLVHGVDASGSCERLESKVKLGDKLKRIREKAIRSGLVLLSEQEIINQERTGRVDD